MVKRLDQCLEPAEDEARDYLKRLKAGDSVLVAVRKPRNVQFHRKYFALLNVAFDNQERYSDREAFRKEVIMRAGYWQEHVHVTGAISYTAKSIAFHSMDDLEFGELYAKSLDAIIEHFMPDTDASSLDRAVEDVLSFG